ncbi:uaa transporter [Trichococcus flocculiformis]|uniref:Glucose uptake protein GlcU n=1 Tax=Trichococcus flocculiformis TaxID=82803 RepID=A0AB38BL73_9LACT|nr:EamA family transporter [Trichococcus flocculiformis]CZR03206.1 uaa transporter [Trichococcus flocculiformis]SFI15655.1 Glucose uptake protein GlcU [Trichococcus flocculiformis]
MWFLFAIVSVLAWGTADLFYKKGSDPKDKYSYLKIVIMVGAVMGIHAMYVLLTSGVVYEPRNMITYLPVSALYILSMAVGYAGLRFLELSISSPVQNSSGAISGLLTFIFLGQSMTGIQFFAVGLITVGVILLSVFEQRFSEAERKENKEMVDRKYKYGAIALLFPLGYALIDSLGTFADAWVFDRGMDEMQANISYELTWLIVAVLAWVYLVWIKKETFALRDQKDRGLAAIFETLGQFFYVFAISANAVIVAPLISSYSMVSVILSRIFLKEKLTAKQYAVIAMIMVGIFILGFE